MPTPPAYIIGYKFGEKNNSGIIACLHASIIKELSRTKMAESNEIVCQTLT